MKPTILITGVSGFSGGHIYTYLRKQGYPTYSHWGRAIGDLSSTHTYQSWFTEFDLQPDVIVHVAAQSPGPGVTNAHIYQNIPAAYNIIQFAKKVGVQKIIYFSSDSVYGDIGTSCLHEDSPIINPSFYGQTKLICEGLLKDSGIPTISLRLPLIVGRGAKRNWLARVMNNVKEGRSVTIYNPYEPFNNAVHVQFLSELVERLIREEWASTYDMIIPVSTGPFLNIRQVVSKIVKGHVSITEELAKTPSHTIATNTIKKYDPWTITKTIDQYVEDEQ